MDDVDDGATPSRRYHSKVREEQAARTRGLIARAAATRFLQTGWAGTSVRSVARAAGVAEATVYSIYGTKAGLAMSLIDSIDERADVARFLHELRAGEGNPRAQLAAQVGFDRRLFEHGAPMLRVILEGRRQEPDLAAAYAEGRSRGERGRSEFFGSWPKKAWRMGMTVERALDVYAVVASFQGFEVATDERGWSADEVERWWLSTLTEQLLA